MQITVNVNRRSVHKLNRMCKASLMSQGELLDILLRNPLQNEVLKNAICQKCSEANKFCMELYKMQQIEVEEKAVKNAIYKKCPLKEIQNI